jgi:hypothetical protein
MLRVNRADDPMPNWFFTMNWEDPNGLQPILQSSGLTPDEIERAVDVSEFMC